MFQRGNKRSCRKAQSTVEYLLIFAAALMVIIIFARPGGVFSRVLNGIYKSQSDYIGTAATQIMP